jgi:hypothetical protein
MRKRYITWLVSCCYHLTKLTLVCTVDATEAILTRPTPALLFHNYNHHRHHHRQCYSHCNRNQQLSTVRTLRHLPLRILHRRSNTIIPSRKLRASRVITTSMEQLSSSSLSSSKTQAQPPLTREELRYQRLVAFGIQNAIPIENPVRSSDHSSFLEIPHNIGKSALTERSAAKPHRTVIDIWDDSSSCDSNTGSCTTDGRYQRDILKSDQLKASCSKNKKRSVDDQQDWPTNSDPINPKQKGRPLKLQKGSSTDKATTNIDRKSDNTTTTTTTTTGRNKNDSPRSFQVATWNVWFGMGDGQPHAALRMRTISRLLQEQHTRNMNPETGTNMNPLWCIGFQEVIPETEQYLQPAFARAKYQFFRQPQPAAYGCAMAIHEDLTILEQGWIPYSVTEMQRGFLYVRAQFPKKTNTTSTGQDGDDDNAPPQQLIFTTTHLESYTDPSYTGAQQRTRQLQQMCTFVEQQIQQHPNQVKVAIMSGDMNWDDERVRSSGMDPNMLSTISLPWKDTWLETKMANKKATTTKTNKYAAPKSKSSTIVEGYTYDAKMNPMLRGSLRRRLDRILVHDNSSGSSRTTGTTIGPTQLLGTEAIPDVTWMKYNSYTETSQETLTAPSDHFGYIVTLQC